MAEEIHDLLVKIRPDTGNTEEELEGVSKQFDETADETERTAGVIGDMSKRLKGFGAVIVGTLTTLAAGLLSQVPVIQESVSLLGGVIDAIALRLDEKLRPAMGDFNRSLIDLQNAILEGEGELSAFLTSYDEFIQLIGLGNPLVFGTVLIITKLQKAFIDAIPAVAELGGTIKRFVASGLGSLSAFFDSVVEGFKNFRAGAVTAWEVTWELIGNRVRKAANNILSDVEGFVNRAISALNRLPRFNIGRVSLGRFETRTREEIIQAGRGRLAARRGDLDPMGGGQAGGMDSRQVDRIIQALQNTNLEVPVNLGNREVARGVEPLLGTGAANIGRVTRTR